VSETRLTRTEWEHAIRTLTDTGEMTDEHRQEFVLWSDALGMSMLVDSLAVERPTGATESTVVGPFWAAGSPLRRYGESIAEPGATRSGSRTGSGRGWRSDHGRVWQNGVNRLYAVRDPDAPEAHLRGRFLTGRTAPSRFLAIR
jgi:hypothetical protein